MRDFSSDHSALALNTATLGHNLDGCGFGWPPERVIDACAERGYGAITFWRREIGNRAAEIGGRAKGAGMEVCGLCRTPYLVGPLALPTRKEIIADIRVSIDMAADLGAKVLTIVVGGMASGRTMTESLGRVRDIVEASIPYAKEAGVVLALEPLNPVYGGDRSCLVTVRDAIDLCEEISDSTVQIAVDVYHVWWDLSLARELKRGGASRIAGFHLCDWLADTRDVLLDRGMMGDGVADLKGIRSAVEGAGYDGYCEVEVFSAHNWWKRHPEHVLDTVLERFRTVC